MITRIEVIPVGEDSRGKTKKNWLKSLGFDGQVKQVKVADVYTIDKKYSLVELKEIASMLTNPITHESTVNKPAKLNGENYIFEVGFLPGVKDNVSGTAQESIEDMFKQKFNDGEAVYYSQMIYMSGDLTKTEAQKIAENLANPLIQRVHIKSSKQYTVDGGMDKIVPKVKLTSSPKVVDVNLDVSDEELTAIGKKGIVSPDGTRRGPLALDLAYMKAIQEHYKKLGRKPTDIEVESIAQTWSEHCKHTIFANPLHDIHEGLFKRYIKKATDQIRKEKGKKDICVSVFKDNSGAIIFDDKYLVTHKVETHNSPSALDPFGGSVTGIVGVNRDTIGFGLGAKPVINSYGFCFADPRDERPLYKGPNSTQKMLSPRRILEGVVAGVNSGGNCSGIPTPQGFVYFDERYKGKPMVFVGTVGIIPKKIAGKSSTHKKAQSGDYIVMVGGRVGLDGIHGATFSSEGMDTGSPATAVQIGDPITQKKLSDAIVKEARDLSLYSSITDNGAGGLSSSVSEMAKESGGCEVTLDKVPLKYPGLDPWQIWISESQERMTLAIPKEKWKKFEKLMTKRGVEATIIGEFTDSGKCVINYGSKKIMDMDMQFLHDGLPVRELEPEHHLVKFEDPYTEEPKDITPLFHKMLSRLNIASFEFISAQFDHEVQATSVTKPLQGRGRINSDSSVTRPILNSDRGVVLSQGFYPSYSEINSYDMAACSIDTAIRNAVVAGANFEHIALLDNFCWCSSTESGRLNQLRRAARACYEISLAYGAPFISGKDSMFNDFYGFDDKGEKVKISIPPTLLITSIGVIYDITKAVTLDAKFAGDLIYVLGETHSELGGSEFYQMHSDTKLGHRLPQVNVIKNIKLYKSYQKALEKGLIASAQSVTRGGLAVALAKTAMGGMLGMDLFLRNLEGEAYRNDFALFSESQGRILVTINPKNRKNFEELMDGNSISLLGKVTADGRFVITSRKDEVLVDTTVSKALEKYKATFKGY